MTTCPAATGFAGCMLWSDGVHRCELDGQHAEMAPGITPAFQKPATERVVHACPCAHRWTCLTGSIDDLIQQLTPGGVR